LDLFQKMAEEGHEQMMFFRGKEGKLRSIIAFHDTTLGPALGGTRMYPYANEDDAVNDALRLSKGMTLKSGAAGLHHGGAKGIIWGDPATDKDEILFRAYGRFIHGLRGRFTTGTDVGTYSLDFVDCLAETPYVVGVPVQYGGSGDTSVLTAYGVFLAIQACVTQVYGKTDCQGLTVAVQGVGKVGSKLCGHLAKAGASLIVADARADVARKVAEEYGARLVEPSEILREQCDVMSPNAMGGVLNEHSISQLRCKIVCGGANNQLATTSDGKRLMDRGILYAPDYVANAGGVIQVADELHGYDFERCKAKVETIPALLSRVFRASAERNIDTDKAATALVEERIARVLTLKSTMAPAR